MIKIYEDNTERLAKLNRIADKNKQAQESREAELRRKWEKIYNESLKYAKRVAEMLPIADELKKLGLSYIGDPIHFYKGGVLLNWGIGCSTECIAYYEKAEPSSYLANYMEDYVTYLATYNGWGRPNSETLWTGSIYSIDKAENKINTIMEEWNNFKTEFDLFEEDFYDYVDSLEE